MKTLFTHLHGRLFLMSICIAGSLMILLMLMPVSAFAATRSYPIHRTTIHRTTIHKTTIHRTTIHKTTHRKTTIHRTVIHKTAHRKTTIHRTTIHKTTIHRTIHRWPVRWRFPGTVYGWPAPIFGLFPIYGSSPSYPPYPYSYPCPSSIRG